MTPLIAVTFIPAERSYRVVTDLGALEVLLRHHVPGSSSRHAAQRMADELKLEVAAASDEPAEQARHVEHLTRVLATAIGEWLMERREG